MLKMKEKVKLLLMCIMFFNIVFAGLIFSPLRVDAATKIAGVSNKKVTLKKSKPKKVKVTCLYLKGAGFSLSVDDPSIAKVSWVGHFKYDKSGRQYCYIKIKGLSNGSTKIKIKNDVNNSVTKISVKVKGFSKTEQFNKLVKDIQKKAYTKIEYNGVSYPAFCLKMDPLMEAAYDKSTGNIILTYSKLEKPSSTSFVQFDTTKIVMFYNAKKPKETKVDIYHNFGFRDSDWYSFQVTSTIDASNYKSGDKISIGEVVENKKYDSVTSMKTNGQGDVMKTLTDEELVDKASSALETGLKYINNSLNDNGGYSLKGIGFKKYK